MQFLDLNHLLLNKPRFSKLTPILVMVMVVVMLSNILVSHIQVRVIN